MLHRRRGVARDRGAAAASSTPGTPDSTYIQEPPFFADIERRSRRRSSPFAGARVLALLGDSVTTDHISPAGAIPADRPAGRYLQRARRRSARDFNTYGSRRGNHEVMMRGTFGNIRLRNQLVPGHRGRRHRPPARPASRCRIYDAAMRYQDEGTPLVVLAGKEYGTGSSRDWAAKGTALLGVRAVIAESFERIHRSNLVGMGVLPLQFSERGAMLEPGARRHRDVRHRPARRARAGPAPAGGGRQQTTATSSASPVTCRLDTPVEVEYYRNGGILHTVLRRLVTE